MLYLSALIRQFARRGREQHGRSFRLAARNFSGKAKDYASWMGFFKSFGLDHGNEPGEASGSNTYIPLTRLAINRIRSKARDEYVHHGEVVERESERIAGVLTRHSNCDVMETLTYAIREIMRNVVEHGDASHLWYAAQYWPSKHKVEIGILDEGVGLMRSLAQNPKLHVTSNSQALFLALQPGVSRVQKKQRRRSDGDWINSGYGLYMTSALCQIGGSFFVSSGDKALKLSGTTSEFLECSYSGVAVRLVLDTSKISRLNDTLDALRRKGEKIASELGNTEVQLTASKMSRMLMKSI